jgi:Rrf2 family transcriptional regulator, iron-sulfur cluster assembly transcription factor
MRITRAGEYAVRCILYMTAREKGLIIGRKEISESMDIPDQFLGKIAQQLARAGIIEIIQGAKGGYRLLKKSKEITLLDVVETVMGEIFLNDCLMNPNTCSKSSSCTVNAVWEKARGQLRATLSAATFDRLLKEKSCISAFPQR